MADGDDTGNGQPERGSGSLIPKMIVGGAAAAAGLKVGHDLTVILGTVAPAFESLAQRAWSELQPDAKRRDAEMLNVTADAADCDAEQLEEMIGATETTRLLTGLAMNAAERTSWPPQVRALGRALADGLLADRAQVSVPQFALSAMVELTEVHVTLLELLVRYEPYWAGDRTDARPYREAAHLPWRVGERVWAAWAVTTVRPQIADVLPGVAGTLVRHGLAEQTDRRIEAMEQLTRDLLHRFNQQSAASGSRTPWPLPPVEEPSGDFERSWSPTQLGQQVLGYYLEAGAEGEGRES